MLNNGNIVCYMSIYYDSRSQEMGRHSTGYGLCNLISARYSERVGGTDAAPTFRLGESREYTAGGHVITGNSVLMSRFGCGYFDASGRPHYYLTDWQGNNIGVVDRDGKIEQRTDYYPYGEPWLEPEATTPGGTTASPTANRNRFLYGDKERIRTGGLNEYCFPARDYVPGFPRFTTIDPMCEGTPWLSPYAYCAGNPVMYTDPTGEDIVVLNYGYTDNQHLAMLIQNNEGKWQYYSINGNNVYISGTHRGGRTFNDIGVGNWDSPQEFLNSNYNERTKFSKDDKSKNHFGFEEAYQISTTSEQDEIMRQQFEEKSKEPYAILGNNCATVVQKVMLEADIPVAEPKYEKIHVPANIYMGESSYDIIKFNINVIPSVAFKSIMNVNPGGKYYRKQHGTRF